MDIQNLIRDKIVGNIKIGTKGANGMPKKLSHFNVEKDKSTSPEMVDVFKQLYPGEPTKLKIRFTKSMCKCLLSGKINTCDQITFREFAFAGKWILVIS